MITGSEIISFSLPEFFVKMNLIQSHGEYRVNR